MITWRAERTGVLAHVRLHAAASNQRDCANGQRLSPGVVGSFESAVCVGIRERRARDQGAGRGPARVQRHRPDAGCGAGRHRPGLCAGGYGADAYRGWAAHPRAGRLVPVLPGLPPLLPELAPPTHAGIRVAGQCTAVPALRTGADAAWYRHLDPDAPATASAHPPAAAPRVSAPPTAPPG